MVLREVVYKIHADKLHIVDMLSNETVVVDPLEPDSLRTVQRFLHCEVVRIVPLGKDVQVTVI